jgi:hypothetical protein
MADLPRCLGRHFGRVFIHPSVPQRHTSPWLAILSEILKFSEGAAQAVAQARYGKGLCLRCDWMRTFRACSDALETAYLKSPDSFQLVWQLQTEAVISISWENRNLTKEDCASYGPSFSSLCFFNRTPRLDDFSPMPSSRRSMIRPCLAYQVAHFSWRDGDIERVSTMYYWREKKTKKKTNENSQDRRWDVQSN